MPSGLPNKTLPLSPDSQQPRFPGRTLTYEVVDASSYESEIRGLRGSAQLNLLLVETIFDNTPMPRQLAFAIKQEILPCNIPMPFAVAVR